MRNGRSRQTICARELLDGKPRARTGQITQGCALAKGIGACFVEVEIDPWTGHAGHPITAERIMVDLKRQHGAT